MRPKYFIIFLFTLFFGIAIGQPNQKVLWNYSCDNPYTDASQPIVRMYLPPSCSTGVKGLILASQTVTEYAFCTDTAVQRVANEQQLGIVFFPSKLAYPSAADTTYFQTTLDTLAARSGFPEIAHCAWFTYGHSTGSYFAKSFIWWKPSRAFGGMVYKGGAIFPTTWADTIPFAQVPILGVSGQREEYGPNGGTSDPRNNEANYLQTRDQILALRAKNHKAGALMLPGEGHFDIPNGGYQLLADYIRAAAQARLPIGVYAKSGPIQLLEKPLETGWLADTTVLSGNPAIDSFPNVAPSDRASKFWFPDRQFATKWKALLNNNYNRMLQTINPQGSAPTLQFIGGSSASTQFDNSGLLWKFNAQVGSKVVVKGTSDASLPVKLTASKASLAPMSGDTITLPAYTDPGGSLLWLSLSQEGNANYRPADRCVRIGVNKRTSGTVQTITFPAVSGPIQAGSSVTLTATASSGLPVEYNILSGSATLSGNVLTVVPFPTLSGKSEVIVVAGQAGNSTTRTADEVTIKIPVTSLITNVKDNPTSAPTLYPNPVMAGEPIYIIGNEYVRATLFDLSGKVIFDKNIIDSKNELKIETNGLLSGVYMVRIIDRNQKVCTHKLIIT